MRSEGHAVLIVIYPRVSHDAYFDSSRNFKKNDYTKVKSLLDSALQGFDMRVARARKRYEGRVHRVSRIKPTSAISINRKEVQTMDTMSSIS